MSTENQPGHSLNELLNWMHDRRSEIEQDSPLTIRDWDLLINRLDVLKVKFMRVVEDYGSSLELVMKMGARLMKDLDFPPDIGCLGHGHVRPRADDVKVQCGGPGLCPGCTRELLNCIERAL